MTPIGAVALGSLVFNVVSNIATQFHAEGSVAMTKDPSAQTTNSLNQSSREIARSLV